MENYSIASNTDVYQKNTAETQPSQDGTNPPKGNGVDLMELAFFYLMEASTISANSANIQAKQLNQNATAQLNLNNQAEQLKWNEIPKLIKNDHTVTNYHYHWTWNPFGGHGNFFYVTETHVHYQTSPNQGIINQNEEKNLQISGDRQRISSQLSRLQQDAQLSGTGIHNTSEESMQAMTAASQLVKILQNMTFKALLRQQPS